MTLEDELVEESETIVIAATGIRGISLSGSPVTLEVHSRECEISDGDFKRGENIFAQLQLC